MKDFDSILINLMKEKASKNIVDTISIGLGYTAVVLKNGNCGLCCTLMNNQKTCTLYKSEIDYENQSAEKLLYTLNSTDYITRAVAIALINALNYDVTENLNIDNNSLYSQIKLKKWNKVAMIGHFSPIVNQMKKQNISVISYDIGKNIGSEKEFYQTVIPNSDILILTATSFINCTFPLIMEKIENYKIPTAVIGPSTIMIPSLYKDTPVIYLGGTHTIDTHQILKAVRNGKGTPDLHMHSKKVYINLT